MRLGYFTMPVHPMHKDWALSLQEDREAVMLADRLGFHDAFIGEHLTDACETITNSMMFLATLISETKTIKLATGTSNLSHIHPVVIAQQAAMFDHLAQGRFIFGVSPGALTSDAEALGILDQDRNKMFAESIDVILAIWEREPPYDIDFPDNRFKVSTSRTIDKPLGIGYLGKPFQKPRPEIVGTVVAPFSPGVVHMGRRDFNSPYRFYWHQMYSKMKRGKRLYVFKSHKDQPDEEITLDYVLDHCMITGSPNRIVDRILALREEVGDFGEIVYAGVDWADPALEKRSMTLMAEQVLPRVNAAIGKSAAA